MSQLSLSQLYPYNHLFPYAYIIPSKHRYSSKLSLHYSYVSHLSLSPQLNSIYMYLFNHYLFLLSHLSLCHFRYDRPIVPTSCPKYLSHITFSTAFIVFHSYKLSLSLSNTLSRSCCPRILSQNLQSSHIPYGLLLSYHNLLSRHTVPNVCPCTLSRNFVPTPCHKLLLLFLSPTFLTFNVLFLCFHRLYCHIAVTFICLIFTYSLAPSPSTVISLEQTFLLPPLKVAFKKGEIAHLGYNLRCPDQPIYK
jgi:hypothetical protein